MRACGRLPRGRHNSVWSLERVEAKASGLDLRTAEAHTADGRANRSSPEQQAA